MKHKIQITGVAMLILLTSALALFAQQPYITINPNRHGNLWSAQQSIAIAYQKVDAAQRANRYRLGGHAARAKDLLNQANQEITMAAQYADGGRGW